MSGISAEEIQVLGILTKSLVQIFVPSKSERKNTGKNPPVIYLGALSNQKFQEVFGDHLNPESVLSRVYSNWTNLAPDPKNDEQFWTFVHEVFTHWQDEELSDAQTNDYLMYSELTAGSSREDTPVKTQLYGILRGFKIKFQEHRNIISSPILAISILLDTIMLQWRLLMSKKQLGLRAGHLWQDLIKVNGIFGQLRTAYEQFLESSSEPTQEEVHQMRRVKDSLLKMTRNLFHLIKNVPRSLHDWSSFTFARLMTSGFNLVPDPMGGSPFLNEGLSS